MEEVAGLHPEAGVLAHAAVVAALMLRLLEVVVVLVVGVDGAEVLLLLEAQQPALAPVPLPVTGVAAVHVLHSGGVNTLQTYIQN